MMIKLFEHLKSFCDENNIIWRFRQTPDFNYWEFEFYRSPSNKKESITIDYHNFCCNEDIETYLIKFLKKEFELDNCIPIIPNIKKVIFNDPATIVLWSDGTKTVVKCENEPFDPEKGLSMVICKKALGTNKSGSNYYDIFKKWLPKEE